MSTEPKEPVCVHCGKARIEHYFESYWCEPAFGSKASVTTFTPAEPAPESAGAMGEVLKLVDSIQSDATAEVQALRAQLAEAKAECEQAKQGASDAYHEGRAEAMSGVHELLARNDDTLVARFERYIEHGDAETNEDGFSFWHLAADQSGTELARLKAECAQKDAEIVAQLWPEGKRAEVKAAIVRMDAEYKAMLAQIENREHDLKAAFGEGAIKMLTENCQRQRFIDIAPWEEMWEASETLRKLRAEDEGSAKSCEAALAPQAPVEGRAE